MIRLRVKEVAQEKGFSQGRLSRVANIDENTLKRIYRDPYAIITTETLDKLAKALGVPSGVLIEDVLDDDKP
jgi:DNA-binding Xre family transcriptional regulator